MPFATNSSGIIINGGLKIEDCKIQGLLYFYCFTTDYCIPIASHVPSTGTQNLPKSILGPPRRNICDNDQHGQSNTCNVVLTISSMVMMVKGTHRIIAHETMDLLHGQNNIGLHCQNTILTLAMCLMVTLVRHCCKICWELSVSG